MIMFHFPFQTVESDPSRLFRLTTLFFAFCFLLEYFFVAFPARLQLLLFSLIF